MGPSIKQSITWRFVFPSKDLQNATYKDFVQPLIDQEEDFDKDGLRLFKYLQEISYVKKLELFDYGDPVEEKEIFDMRDDCWEKLGDIFSELFVIIQNNPQLLSYHSTYKALEDLLCQKDKKRFIYKKMPGEYALRYRFFLVATELIPSLKKEDGELVRRYDVICKWTEFKHFFKRTLKWIEDKLYYLQTCSVQDLENLYKEWCDVKGDKFKKFKARYLDGNSCFSDTIVERLDTDIHILCFSGAKAPTKKVKDAIEYITTKYLLFGIRPITIWDVPLDTKYMLAQIKTITFEEAKLSKIYIREKHGRMFSCCERKTFAGYPDWNKCISFRMFVRFAPCELCAEIVKEYKDNYNGTIRHGDKYPGLRTLYDPVANAIYNKMHKKPKP